MSYLDVPRRSVLSPPTGVRLDAAVVALSWLMIAGIAADFRVHAQTNLSFSEEGFFTPEHTFFYSMFLLIAVLLGAVAYRNRRQGAAWTAALPAGYGWGAVGVAAFGLGGLADYVWHSTFGFEQGVEALTSPSHLLLAGGAVLFLSAPLRAVLARAERPSGLAAVPAIVGTSLALTAIVLIAGYLNPVANEALLPIALPAWRSGIAPLLALPTILVGAALVLDRGVDLPPGGVTLLFVHPALASVVVSSRFELALAFLAAGLVGDAIVRLGGASREGPRALRAFGALVPATFTGGVLAILELTDGVVWTIHIWAGCVVLAACAGLLLTYVVLPMSPRVVEGEPA